MNRKLTEFSCCALTSVVGTVYFKKGAKADFVPYPSSKILFQITYISEKTRNLKRSQFIFK